MHRLLANLLVVYQVCCAKVIRATSSEGFLIYTDLNSSVKLTLPTRLTSAMWDVLTARTQ